MSYYRRRTHPNAFIAVGVHKVLCRQTHKASIDHKLTVYSTILRTASSIYRMFWFHPAVTRHRNANASVNVRTLLLHTIPPAGWWEQSIAAIMCLPNERRRRRPKLSQGFDIWRKKLCSVVRCRFASVPISQHNPLCAPREHSHCHRFSIAFKLRRDGCISSVSISQRSKIS